MPASPRKTVLCRYHYDPLDRLVGSEPSAQAYIQRVYCKSRLATEVQGAVQRSVFQHNDQLLAQQQSQSGKLDTTLLATEIGRANYPPSYFQRPDSPPPIYRSSPLSRAPNTPGELPPPYEGAAQDPLVDIRVTTIRTGWFLRKAQITARLIRD